MRDDQVKLWGWGSGRERVAREREREREIERGQQTKRARERERERERLREGTVRNQSGSKACSSHMVSDLTLTYYKAQP